MPCVWALIYNRLSELGELDRLTTYCGPKDWAPRGESQRPPAIGPEGLKQLKEAVFIYVTQRRAGRVAGPF